MELPKVAPKREKEERNQMQNATWTLSQRASAEPKSPNFNVMQFVPKKKKRKKKCACTPFAWQKASFSSFPSPSWECNSERHPGDWVTPRVSHSAVKSHLSWLGAYSTHLLEVSHFQHYILILVSGAHQEKLRQAVWDRRDFCTRMQILLSQSTDTDAAPKKKKKKKEEASFYFAAWYNLPLVTLPALLSLQPISPLGSFSV